MSVTPFQDLPLADREREWDGAAAEKRVREWSVQRMNPTRSIATLTSGTTATRRHFTAYKLVIADVVGGKLEAVPRGVMAAGAIMQGSRGGVDLPKDDIDRVRATSRSTTRRWVTRPPGSAEPHPVVAPDSVRGTY